MLRRPIAVLVAVATLLVGLAAPGFASGSGTLFPQSTPEPACAAGGNCRAPIEWRTDGYGPQVPVLDAQGRPTGTTRVAIHRRTLFTVYANAGEQILMGSSSIGTGSADAVVWNPGVVTDTEADTLPAAQFSCVAQRATSGSSTRGALPNRTQELAGAQSVDGTGNTAGYRPCYYTAPTSGLYRLAFYGSAGAAAATNGTPDPSLTTTTFATDANDSAIDAWDITVRAAALSSTTDLTGRIFTYAYAGFTGGNARPVTMTMYLNTLDGFRYRVNTNGFDPNGFLFYGNRTGFVDSDGTPLNHDVLGTGSTPQSLSSTVGGTGIGAPEYPLSLEPLAPETLAALGIPATPSNPTITDVVYQGKTTAKGSYVAKGGTFSFSTGTAGTYQIVISRDGSSFDPGLSTNRVLRGVVDAAGTYTVAWDGLDNAKTAFPAKDGYAVQATLRGGEYHAPMIDVESSVKGGPSITLLNPPSGTCPFSGAVSDGSNCTRAFYDDRGYVAANGQTVGVVGGWLCNQTTSPFAGLLPTSSFADPVTGYDSTGTQRAFGTTTATNANQLCPATNGTLGDAKGLDVWTYFPSAVLATTLDVLPKPTAPTAAADTATTPAGTPLTVPASSGLEANDTGTNLGVTAPAPGTATATAKGGSVTVAADGSYTYTPPTGFSGTDTFPYTISDDAGQTASSQATITVTPVAPGATISTDAGVTGGTMVTPLLTGGTALGLLSFGTAAHGTTSTAGFGTNQALRYTPEAGFSGTDSFTYTLQDYWGRTATGTVTVTVRPVATADFATTPVRTVLDVAASGVLANDLGSSLTAALVAGPAHGTLTLRADGSYRYVPETGRTGAETFTYTATGPGGASLPATVTILVTPVAPDDAGVTSAGTPLVVTAPGVLANDDGTGLTVSSSTQPAHGAVTVLPTGAYTYTPAAGYSGPDSFTYTARDGAGTTVTATVTLTVLPVAVAHARTIDPGPTTFAASDLLDGDAGTALAVVDHGGATHGTVSQAGQALTYTPTAGFSGVDTLTYTVRDGAGQEATAAVTVTVRPRATDDTATVTAGGTLTGASVLANDSGAHLAATVVTGPAHGTLALAADGTWSYVPAAAFTGVDTFTYRATGDGGTSDATVTVTVTPPASPSAGADDVRTGTPGHTVTLDPTANDTPSGHGSIVRASLMLLDPTTGAPAATVTTQAGVWRVLAAGTIGFTPADGYAGTARVEYQVLDSNGQTISAWVAVAYPDPPASLAATGSDVRVGALAAALLVGLGALLLSVARPTRAGARRPARGRRRA